MTIDTWIHLKKMDNADTGNGVPLFIDDEHLHVRLKGSDGIPNVKRSIQIEEFCYES